MSERIEHVGAYVKRLSELIDRRMNNQLRALDVSASQIRVLVALKEAGGTMSAKDLETHVGVAQSTMWGIVRRLEDKDLVLSAPVAPTGRSKQVSLTEAGERVLEGGRQFVDENERALLSGLTPEESAELLRLLRLVLSSAEDAGAKDAAESVPDEAEGPAR